MPKHTPFSIKVHYVGEKSNDQLQELYADFYINQVKNQLIQSNLTQADKKKVIARLISQFSQIPLGI